MFKRLPAPLATALLILPLASGCAAVPLANAALQIATSHQAPADRITMDERGLYAMEALYNVPASAYRTAVQRHLMTPSIRARVRPILLQMRNIRNAARTAKRLGDVRSWDARVSELQALKRQVLALIPSTT